MSGREFTQGRKGKPGILHCVTRHTVTHVGDDPHWDPFIKQQYHSADLSFTFLNSDLSVIILYADMENLNYVIRLFFFNAK